MAQRYGPRIVTDSLVLCLDAHDAKSYAGETTTNLILDGDCNDGNLPDNMYFGYNKTYSVVDCPYDEDGFRPAAKAIKFVKTDSTDGRFTFFNMGSLSTGSSNPYVASCWVYIPADSTATTASGFPRWNSDNVANSINISYLEEYHGKKGKWARISSKWYSVNGAQTHGLRGVASDPTGSIMYITNVQNEFKSYATPFVDGSRVGTNGILDRSGNGNHGTLYNTVGTKASHYKKGQVIMPVANYIDLDGTTSTQELITLGAASKYFSPNFAWEIWFKSAGLGTGMSLGGLIYIDYGLGMYINGSGNLTVNAYDYAGGYPGTAVLSSTFTMSPSLFNNEWRHVIVTLGAASDGTYEVYVDGVKTHNGTVPTGWNGNSYWGTLTARIGSNPNNIYYNLKGQVALARIYHKHLTEAEAIGNYNATKGRFS